MLMRELGEPHRLPARPCRGSQWRRAERSKAPRGGFKLRTTWNRLRVRKTEEKQKEALAAAEGKEWRLGDITVSSHRPVLHCSYWGERQREYARGGVSEEREGGRTNEKYQWGDNKETLGKIQQNNEYTAVPKTPRPLRQANIYAAHQREHAGAGSNREKKNRQTRGE